MALLELRHVVKTFAGPDGTVRALDGLSLRVEPGEFVAVEGPSGCGKTTLLLAAGGLLRPNDGAVAIEGRDPYGLTPEQRAGFRAGRIGFVFQQFHLIPYLNVLDNILAPSMAVGAGCGEARERAMELAGRFGLQDRLRHVPAALSTGERQRAALARALLNRPCLLLADEPTGNLDTGNGRLVLRCLADFAAEGGAVLLVTHDVEAAAQSTRRLCMRGGRFES